MMIKEYLKRLGMTIARKEGDEYICECPWCNGHKFYVNGLTGAWQCFHGCGQGWPYQLAQKLTTLEASAIFELLDEFGLKGGQKKLEEPKKPRKPKIKPAEIKPLHPLDQLVFCHAKNVDRESLMLLDPKRHALKPWALLPVYNPDDMQAPCGWIRAGVDGQLVPIRYKDENDDVQTKMEKYPVVAGSSAGLVGLPALTHLKSYDAITYAEGWKDCLAAWSVGLPAVCNSHGAKSWNKSFLKVFKDKVAYLVFDQDKAGRDAAVKHAAKIAAVAKTVHIVELPYEFKDKDGNDLHDYIREDHHTREDLLQLYAQAPVFTPPEPEAGEPSEQADVEGMVILCDDHPDTLAVAFQQWSVDTCNVKHRYHPQDGWTIYRDGKYQEVDPKQQIAKYLSQFARKCFFKKGKRKERVRLSSRKIADVLQQLSFLEGVYLMPKQSAPCSIDGALDTTHTIALQNGLLDWSGYPYKLHDCTEQYYTLNYLPYEWNGEKDSELWIRFLIDVTNGDEELFDMLQQWAGYCLMKHNQNEQRFMVVYGEGGTGKSVFVDVVTHLLGRENVSAIPLEKFDDPHYAIQTYGKMLNVTDESESHLEESIEAHLKHYTGGTVYTFKRLYQEPFSAYPTAKVMIVTNHLPAFKDTSDGVWRRLLIAPFDVIIPEEKRVKGLSRKIIDTEMPGVLKWALEGARKVEKYGFIVPQVCKDAVEEYRREAVPEMIFFEENYISCDPEELDARVRCDVVRRHYEQWCKDQGVGVKSQKKIAKTMKKLFPLFERKRGRDGLNLSYFYYGVKASPDNDFITESTCPEMSH